jgi:hypothetical protein
MSSRSPTRILGSAALLAATAACALLVAAPKAAVPTRPAGTTEYPLTVAMFATDPGRPKAGRLFTAGAGIMDEETGEPLDSGTVHCRARIGSRRVHLVRKMFVTGSGLALCAWNIPAQTGGKRLYGRIEVYSYDYGVSVTKKFSRVIRP